MNLMHFLFISIFLYACELWTLTVELENKKAVLRDEMILKVIKHFVQGPYNQSGGSQKDHSSHWRI